MKQVQVIRFIKDSPTRTKWRLWLADRAFRLGCKLVGGYNIEVSSSHADFQVVHQGRKVGKSLELVDNVIKLRKPIKGVQAEFMNKPYDEFGAVKTTDKGLITDCNLCKYDGEQMFYPSGCTGCCAFNGDYKNFEPKEQRGITE